MLFILNRRQTLNNEKDSNSFYIKLMIKTSSALSKLREVKNKLRSIKMIDEINLKKAKFKTIIKSKILPRIQTIKTRIKSRTPQKILNIKSLIINKTTARVVLSRNYYLVKIKPKLSIFKKKIREKIGLAGFLKEPIRTDPKPIEAKSSSIAFTEWNDHSSSLRQGKHWSSTIIALCSTMFVAFFIWAFTARIDQTITVRGRLQPSGSVREVESPSAGVVSKVFIKDGDIVSTGEPLFIVEAKGLASQREGLTSTLAILEVQASSLRAIIDAKGDSSKIVAMPPITVINDPDLSSKLVVAQQQSQLILSQLSQIAFRLESKEKTLMLQIEIAQNLKPLYEVGAIARNQYLNKLNQVQEAKADVQSLRQERTRILGQAAVQLSQLNTQMISLRSKLVEIGETLAYRTVKAPIDGKIFDAKVSPYSVVNGGATVLKIVPDNRLEAAVTISNKDIGFVKTGMDVNVSVDSFPSGEFGYLQGTLKSIGSDALPPDKDSQGYNFPATIILKQQEVESGGKSLNLQSGMGVNANIKLRSRPVISILTDVFTKQIEGVSRFR